MMGRKRQPTPLTVKRIGIWERGCKQGLTALEIADRIGIDVSYLRKIVVIGRKFSVPGAEARPPRFRGRTTGEDGSYLPSEKIALRLRRWRELSALDWTTAEIARELRISTATLQRSVQRARARGHRNAVQHPRAGGTGLTHLYDHRARAARARRRQREDTASVA